MYDLQVDSTEDRMMDLMPLASDRPGIGIYWDEHDRLLGHPDAYMMLADLRRCLSCRDEPFALANAMHKRLGYTLPRFRTAKKKLIDLCLLEITHPGGRGPTDPPRARLLF
jgi:hypothetical protein